MRQEEPFELVEGLLTSGSPIPAIVFLGEVQEGAGDGGVVGYEPTVEVGKAAERSDVLDFGWGWPGGDAVKFDRVHSKLTGFHDHSEVFDLGDVELAFLELEMKVKLSHSLEDAASSLGVGLGIGGGDKEVVHVDDELSFSDHVPERVVHEPLERGRGVAKAKEHDSRFEESFVCDESGLPLVAVLDTDIVVPPSNVKFGEVASIFQLVHEVRDKGKGVGVSGGVFVEVSVVLAGTEFAILLFDEEEGGRLEGV